MGNQNAYGGKIPVVFSFLDLAPKGCRDMYILGHVITLFCLIFNFGECFFVYLFIVEIDPKDEILPKN